MRVNLLGVEIDSLTMGKTVELVDRYIAGGKPLHLMGVNADKINSAVKDSAMRDIVNGCGVINADGASVVLASRFLGSPLPERVAGIDLMQELAGLCEKKGYGVFLLGAKPEIVERTASVMSRRWPRLRIRGTRDGYFPDSEWPSIARMLEEARPQVVFVGITSPKKEYLIEYLLGEGLNCVFMGVGGSFDVISGAIPRAPEWMRKWNMEWLFRMLQEPGRLFKRYLAGNTVFIGHVLRARFSGRG